MRLRLLAVIVVLGSIALPAAHPRTVLATDNVPSFDHVFVIAMENKAYSDVIGNAAAPYTNRLVAQYGVASRYYSDAHPSLPNYLERTGGSTFGVTTDCYQCWVSGPNIADSVEHAGKTWKAYMESMPSPCYTGPDTAQYTQLLNPFIYYDDIRLNPARCNRIVPFTQLSNDLSTAVTTPSYGWITPNICDNMHNCPVATGDAWLANTVGGLLSSPAFTSQRSLLLISWDEDWTTGTNHPPTVVVGSGVDHGYVSTFFYTHYSLLKTVEVGLGLPPLTVNDAAASPMSDFFEQRLRLGGLLASSPHAGSGFAPGALDVVAEGMNHAVWHDYSRDGGTTWHWESLGGYATSSPTILAQPNRLDVFVRGGDSAIWRRTWTGSAWTSWTSIGGRTLGGADVASPQPGTIALFCRGTDDRLWGRVLQGTVWGAWFSLGGYLTADPGVVSSSAGSLDVFVRGSDGSLWHRWTNGAAWSGWAGLGGRMLGAPRASSWGGGREDVFLDGTDNAIWHRAYDGTNWLPWGSEGGIWTAEPSATSPAAGSIDVFDRGTDGSLWEVGLGNF